MTEAGGPYTTITVEEYSRMAAVIRHLRKKVQKARQHLEKGETQPALQILAFEDEHELS